MTNRSRLAATLLSTLFAGGALVAWSSDASAQAWVGEKGSLNADVRYTFGTSKNVIEADGGNVSPDDEYLNTNHTTTFSVDYIPIDKLLISAQLPFMANKYNGDLTGESGAFNHNDFLGADDEPVDNNDFNFALTDLRVGARYQVLSGSNWAISPNVGFSAPVMDYQTAGYSAFGRHILKGHVGAAAGYLFDPWVPNLFVQGSYEFTKGAKADDFDGAEIFNQDYSDVVVGLGYVVMPELIVQLSSINHWSHGGFKFINGEGGFGDDFGRADDFPNLVQDLIARHDNVLDEDYFLAGLDMVYQVTDALSLSASAHFFLDGESSRDVNAFAFGLSYQILEPTYEPIPDDWDDEEWGDEDVGEEGDLDGEVEGELPEEGAVDEAAADVESEGTGLDVDASVDVDASADVGSEDEGTDAPE